MVLAQQVLGVGFRMACVGTDVLSLSEWATGYRGSPECCYLYDEIHDSPAISPIYNSSANDQNGRVEKFMFWLCPLLHCIAH